MTSTVMIDIGNCYGW